MNEVEVQARATTPDELAGSAAGPVRWLLDSAANGGVPLTQTNAPAATSRSQAPSRKLATVRVPRNRQRVLLNASA